jgi:two-component system phosphate regulon sensor histidine kinase PhoR
MASRLFLLIVSIALGGILGMLTGDMLRAPLLNAVLGAAIGVSLLALFDSVRSHRLIQWLKGSQVEPAPRDAGLWGELGYRIERLLRERDKALARESLQLGQFLSAIEASPNGVLMLDAQEHMLWCNKVAADHFSLDPVRDRHQRITNLVRSPAFVAHLQAGRNDGTLLLSNPRGPGTLALILRSYGEGMRLVLSQDVTERERAEAMRRDFVANVSHEIRTPLTVLAGFIETMDSLSLSEPERKHVLQLMTQQAHRMQTLVGDLLTLAQLEGSPRPAADRWVSVDAMLGHVASEGRALSAGRHQLVVTQDCHAELAGQEGELLSAMTNLVNNAVRYTPEGGHIDVNWQLHADGSAELAVSDTGPGIAREHLPRLSERFYRVDSSRSRETGGTGLGLSIVKHVVQRHGGELDIQSTLGQGSRFRLVFPAARVRQMVGHGDASAGQS